MFNFFFKKYCQWASSSKKQLFLKNITHIVQLLQEKHFLSGSAHGQLHL